MTSDNAAPPAPSFAPFEALMREDGQPELAITVFRHHFERLAGGATGLIPESAIEPVARLRDAEGLEDHRARGRTELDRLVVIKLNGGLGTSMGMDKAKSLLPVKDGRTFLDLIADQVVHQRVTRGARLPLILMDSFRTQADSLRALAPKRGLAATQSVPLSFLQHRVPKVLAHDLSPASHATTRRELAWCPPGHGDVYPALVTSGLLAHLREQGFRWAFVSNSDNLGATVDDVALGILGWMAANELRLVMECADRTAADNKGGHLARGAGDGRMLLREVAQCPPEDAATFQDIERHRYFNTNNLWLDLEAVANMMASDDWIDAMPLIRNAKPLDPADESSPRVYQLETAMGAAISLLPNAGAVRVPRARFVPVKTTNDLFLLRSDCFERTREGFVRPRNDDGTPLARIDLDPRYFKNIDDFNGRVREVPSLVAARSLSVRGDVRFERGVIVRGDATLLHPGPEPLVLSERVLEGASPHP